MGRQPPPHGSPERALFNCEDVPRFFWHYPRVKVKKGEGLKAYQIRELEAADHFGPGYKEGKYIWMSMKPWGERSVVIDITKLDNGNLRFTGQTEGHMLHRGDIPESAIVRRKLRPEEMVELLPLPADCKKRWMSDRPPR